MKSWGIFFVILQCIQLGFCALLDDVPDSLPYHMGKQYRPEGEPRGRLDLRDFEPGSPGSDERKKVIRALEVIIRSCSEKNIRNKPDPQGDVQPDEFIEPSKGHEGSGDVLDDWIEQMDP